VHLGLVSRGGGIPAAPTPADINPSATLRHAHGTGIALRHR
jgi:hypothetical protein